MQPTPSEPMTPSDAAAIAAEAARRKLNLPAILIMVAEGIGIATQLAVLIFGKTIGGVLGDFAAHAGQHLPANAFAPNPALSGIGIGGGLLVIFAMTRARALKLFPLALIGSILAMVPVASSCCCLGLPLGVWMAITLFDPDVRASFT